MARIFIGNVKGVGIEAIYKQYYASASSTEVVGGEWVDVAPTLTGNQFLWSRWKVKLTDGSTETTDAVQEGIAGNDITSLEEMVSGLSEQTTGLDEFLQTIAPNGVIALAHGGTGSSEIGTARQNINFIGEDPIASVDEDLPEKWAVFGTGHAYISGAGTLSGKPANNGIVESVAYGTLVIQVFTSWASGTTGRKWSRIGNNTYGWATAWTQLLDESTGVQKALIWSNASLTSQFGAQTLSNVKWSDYDKIGLEYQYSDTNIDSNYEEVRPASGGRVLMHETTLSTSRVPQFGERTMVFNADGTISFTQGYIGLASGNVSVIIAV